MDVVNTTLGILKDLQKLVRQRGACGTNKLMQRASQKDQVRLQKQKYIATLPAEPVVGLIQRAEGGLPSQKDQEVEMRAKTTSAIIFILLRGCTWTMYVRAHCSSSYRAVSSKARQCAAV